MSKNKLETPFKLVAFRDLDLRGKLVAEQTNRTGHAWNIKLGAVKTFRHSAPHSTL